MSYNKLVIVAAFFLAGIYVTMPGCGKKDSGGQSATPVPGIGVGPTVCQPGQPCVPQSGSGLPLLNGQSVSSLDSQGSVIVLNFTAAGNVNPGQPYNGPVNITGTIRFAPYACFNSQVVDLPIQGQGVWVGGYGGAIAAVEGTLQSQSGTVSIYSGSVRTGPDPMSGLNTPYYMTGQVSVQACQRAFIAM